MKNDSAGWFGAFVLLFTVMSLVGCSFVVGYNTGVRDTEKQLVEQGVGEYREVPVTTRKMFIKQPDVPGGTPSYEVDDNYDGSI